MNTTLFWQTFLPELILMLSVCPVFITIANVSTIYGYKQGLFIALATFLASLIHITTSAFLVQYFILSVPKLLIIVLQTIGLVFLLNLAYTFWKKDIEKIKEIGTEKFDKSLFIKVFCFASTCVVSISTNFFIFASISENIHLSFLSALIGAYFGVIVGKLIIIVIFGTIGKKLNRVKFLTILNNIASILLFCYAILFVFKICKGLNNAIIYGF